MDNAKFTAMVKAVDKLSHGQQKYLAHRLNTKLSSTEVDQCIEGLSLSGRDGLVKRWEKAGQLNQQQTPTEPYITRGDHGL